MPAVSAILVSHRQTPFLRAAVESVLAQTFRDLELVLVDNGCGIGRDALGPSIDDPRLRLVRLSENRGIPAAHEAAMAWAQGEFAMLLDHDDIALPSRLERQVAAMRADPALGLVSSVVDTIDGTGRKGGREFSLTDAGEQRAYMRFALPVVTPAFSGRSEVFRRFPRREAFNWCSDFDQISRISEVWRTRGLPEVLTQYRRHAEQVTVLKQSEMLLEICTVRLLAARRAAGRQEDFAAAVATMNEWRSLPPGDFLPRFASQFLSEGFADLAAYHARLTLAHRRNPLAVARAMAILTGATFSQPSRAAFHLRLFLSGPVRALGLKTSKTVKSQKF